ncbi:MAG: beta-ketoacyl synthase N-terminal-like domain-containing protein [Candidatus Makana argininalis]
MKRAVITGLGIISSIGNNKNEILNSLINGKSGIIFSKKFNKYGMKSNVCGNIKLKKKININRKLFRFMNKASIYSVISMIDAIKDANLSKSMISNDRTGIIVGSGIGFYNIKNNLSFYFNKKNINPYILIKSMPSIISACLGIYFKIKGINYSISSACSTSSNCIGNAMEIINLGKQDIIFAGGADELCFEVAYKFDSINLLSKNFNDKPKKSSRSYDINRDGFVISGGSGILVIEELNHALKRGARIYSEIIGYGSSSDGKDMLYPSGEGSLNCMKKALKDINCPIDYINTHGTSTIIGDIVELLSIKKIFYSKIPYISSTKSMTGHSLGASGVHEIIFTILMLKNNFIAPSINIYKLDPKIIGMNIITKTKYCNLNTAMINNFGFGGVNVSIVIKKYI